MGFSRANCPYSWVNFWEISPKGLALLSKLLSAFLIVFSNFVVSCKISTGRTRPIAREIRLIMSAVSLNSLARGRIVGSSLFSSLEIAFF